MENSDGRGTNLQGGVRRYAAAGRTMREPEKNLRRYLKTEALITGFFGVFGYCLSCCIQPAVRAAGGGPVAACCKKRYYRLYDLEHPAFDLLRRERERLYGAPASLTWADAVSPCEYHDPHRGCVLHTHKSPVCLAFFCREGIDCLRRLYGIYTYDYLGTYYALEWILTGDLSEKAYSEFRDAILTMTETVRVAGCVHSGVTSPATI